jgi:hypothetical protein
VASSGAAATYQAQTCSAVGDVQTVVGTGALSCSIRVSPAVALQARTWKATTMEFSLRAAVKGRTDVRPNP